MNPLLRPEPLTKDSFAPFGDVIEIDGSQFYLINGGMVQRYHDLARIDVAAEGGHALLNLFRGKPYDYPLAVQSIERHPLGSQAFMPLSATPFAVIVAPRGDQVTPADLRAFISDGHQGVSYRRNTWHHGLLALGQTCHFLVIDRGGPEENCDEVVVDPAVVITA